MIRKILSKLMAKDIVSSIDYSIGTNENAPERQNDFFDLFSEDFQKLLELKKDNRNNPEKIESISRLLTIINDAFFGGDMWGEHLIPDKDIQKEYEAIKPNLLEIRNFALVTSEYFGENYIDIVEFDNDRQYLAAKLQEKYSKDIQLLIDLKSRLISNLHK